MSGSIATHPDAPHEPAGPLAGAEAPGRLRRWLDALGPGRMAVGFFLVALAVYVASNPGRADRYDHFVWQAHAFLAGRAEIEWPVTSGPHQNAHLHDVLPLPATGFALLPFPPLPALVLVPVVAVFGLGTNGALVAAVLGAVNVALCWLVLVRLTRRLDAAALATVFYGFGTVAWYASMLGTTWFLAHVVASTCLFLGIGAALRADHRALVRADDDGPERRDGPRQAADRSPGAGSLPGQLVAGLFLGAAALARLTTVFGAPFFALVGGGGPVGRAVAAGLGAAVPLAVLVAYNVATTGSVLHPAYAYLYEVEYRPRPELVNPAWGIEDVRYIPQNAGIMLGALPETPLLSDPSCRDARVTGLGILADRRCPILRPDPLGMSLLLVSPGYLLAVPALVWGWRRRVVAGAGLAVLAIALADLAHFSQGWVQFGYRFSNDFAPFATLLVALGIARSGVGPVSLSLVGASVLVNAWGVWWGVTLGW